MKYRIDLALVLRPEGMDVRENRHWDHASIEIDSGEADSPEQAAQLAISRVVDHKQVIGAAWIGFGKLDHTITEECS